MTNLDNSGSIEKLVEVCNSLLAGNKVLEILNRTCSSTGPNLVENHPLGPHSDRETKEKLQCFPKTEVFSAVVY